MRAPRETGYKIFVKEYYHYIFYKYIKGKGKAIPLQAWTGPEGTRRSRLPDFKTFGT